MLWVVWGRPNKSHFHIYIRAVEINLKSHQEKKKQNSEKTSEGATAKLSNPWGLSYLHVWDTDFFLAVLLNGAWHFHYSRKLNWLIFLQALYVCYFREVHRREQLFQHLHKRNANVDVLSEEKWFQSLAWNLFFKEGIRGYYLFLKLGFDLMLKSRYLYIHVNRKTQMQYLR